MPTEIKAPSPGESITQVTLASWLVADGGMVTEDAEVAEIESDKATLVVYAPVSGKLSHSVTEGTNIRVGSVIGTIDEQAKDTELMILKPACGYQHEYQFRP